MYMVAYEDNSSYCLAHHGIKGQKWGIRRYQNEDGTLTLEGEKRYSNNLNGRANFYDDMKKGATKEAYDERGGKKGMKAEYKKYKEKMKAQKKKSWQRKDYFTYVNDIVENKMVKEWGDLDEYKRDKYASLTRQQVAKNTASLITAAALGGYTTYDISDYRGAFKKYDEIVKKKKEMGGEV